MTDTKEQADAKRKVDDEAKARHDANVEAGQRQAKLKPTPTQRENDLAKLGALNIDEKEPDGSEPDPHALQPPANPAAPAEKKTMTAEESSSSYSTRTVKK